MEKPVNGICDKFYNDLGSNYLDEGAQSFLYRYFREENVTGLLEKYFPEFSVESHLLRENKFQKIKKELTGVVKKRPEWYKNLLLRAVPDKTRKERRDFWEELWLNDIGYMAGLISDSDYYLWLVEYLAARDIFYKYKNKSKNVIMKRGSFLLGQLLREGLQDMECAWNECHTNAQVGRDLAELARLIQKERNIIASRLHGLKRSVEKGKEDYLLWLTARLEQIALRIKIETWLQDNGYPLSNADGLKKSSKGPRKQDFTMRLFETYCDSEEGYEFIRKDKGGMSSHVDNRFCTMWESDQIDSLLEVLKKSKKECFFIPLEVDLKSGCIFFLAGKGNYESVYEDIKNEREKERLKKEYRDTNDTCCYDFLRLKKQEVDYSRYPEGLFRLEPVFHDNAGKSYETIHQEFLIYCTDQSRKSLRQKIKEFNEEKPDGIPDVFEDFFKDPKDDED